MESKINWADSERLTRPTRAAQIIEAYAREIPYKIHKVRIFWTDNLQNYAVKPAPRMGFQYTAIANSGEPISYKIVTFFGFSGVLKELGYALRFFSTSSQRKLEEVRAPSRFRN